MREGEVRERAFAMPLTSPAYTPGPYRLIAGFMHISRSLEQPLGETITFDWFLAVDIRVATTMPASPDEFGAFVAAETEKWAKVVKFSGARVE